MRVIKTWCRKKRKNYFDNNEGNRQDGCAMKKPSQRTINLQLKKLRSQSENHHDPAVARISQAMETAIRWTTEETEGWATPALEAQAMAVIVNREIRDEILKKILD